MNAITEWSALPATELFLRDDRHGSDFSAFLLIWFTGLGVLMASPRRAGKPLHPTNLHVARRHFPNDTGQSRVPDPARLERWRDRQIRFDSDWERRVIAMILHNLSSFFRQTFATARELNRYRKSLAAA